MLILIISLVAMSILCSKIYNEKINLIKIIEKMEDNFISTRVILKNKNYNKNYSEDEIFNLNQDLIHIFQLLRQYDNFKINREIKIGTGIYDIYFDKSWTGFHMRNVCVRINGKYYCRIFEVAYRRGIYRSSEKERLEKFMQTVENLLSDVYENYISKIEEKEDMENNTYFEINKKL